MKDIWTGRVGRAVTTYAEQAPAATACCNACRACVTTNVVGFVMAALAATGVGIGRTAKRFAARV